MKHNPWARPDLEPQPAPLLKAIPELLLTDLELYHLRREPRRSANRAKKPRCEERAKMC